MTVATAAAPAEQDAGLTPSQKQMTRLKAQSFQYKGAEKVDWIKKTAVAEMREGRLSSDPDAVWIFLCRLDKTIEELGRHMATLKYINPIRIKGDPAIAAAWSSKGAKQGDMSADDIVKLQDELQLDNKEFARRVGRTHTTVSKWRKGKSAPTRKDVQRIREMATARQQELAVVAHPSENGNGHGAQIELPMEAVKDEKKAHRSSKFDAYLQKRGEVGALLAAYLEKFYEVIKKDDPISLITHLGSARDTLLDDVMQVIE